MNTDQHDIRKLVLIVDDDPGTRLLLSAALESAGFRVQEAEDGEQALALLVDYVPDLIMLDVMMPGMDGFEVCARIRDNPERADIPIVMVTGNNDQDSIRRAYDMGVTDFITKPITWEVISYRIDFILRATKAFADLKKSEKRLVHAQQIAKIGSWEWVLESDSMWFSDEALRIFHLAPQEYEASYQSFIANIHPDDRTHVEHAVIDAIEHSGSYSIDHQLSLADGTSCHVHTEAAVIRNSSGVAIRLEGTIQDISERKQAEQEKVALEQKFQQNQKLESLGVLAGGIAHDFNNILAIIIGHCFMVKLQPETAEKHVPEIEKAVERAADLCRQMLAYSGKAPFVQTQVDMGILVDDMVKMLKSTVSKKTNIKFDCSPDIPLIRGDAGQIRQIVMNLISNASEAIGDKQGEIHVSLARITIRAEQACKDHLGHIIPPGRYACLEVSDTGCGMDDETRERIFEPFYTTKFTGRGLGMSAVLGIINAHGGALQLSSYPGQGATFKVYLPIQIGHAAGDEALQQGAPLAWQGSGTILLVEDEEQIVSAVKAMLKAMGFAVIEAPNGRVALELYRKHADKITLIVTDVGMPVMDGYELIRELKSLNRELPIIISSGFGDADVTSRIPREHIAGLVSKPYNFDQLQEVLKGVVDDALKQSEMT